MSKDSSGVGLSEILTPRGGARRLKIADLVEAAADRGQGWALFLAALPALVPFLPPGASMIVGMIVIVVALQMLFGSPRLWLPKRVREYRFSEKATEALVSRAGVLERWVSRFSHERWPAMTGQIATSFVTLPVICNGIVLFLPLPFLNTLPALGIMAVGLGLANRDGLLVLGGAAVCTAVAIFVGASPALIVRGLHSVGI